MNVLFWFGAAVMVTAWAKAGQLILEGKKLYQLQLDKETDKETDQGNESPVKTHENSPNRLVQLFPVSRKEARESGVSE